MKKTCNLSVTRKSPPQWRLLEALDLVEGGEL